MGRVARRKSAHLIVKTIQKMANNNPVVLTSDFNSEDKSQPYKTIASSSLRDARIISQLLPVGLNSLMQVDLK